MGGIELEDWRYPSIINSDVMFKQMSLIFPLIRVGIRSEDCAGCIFSEIMRFKKVHVQ